MAAAKKSVTKETGPEKGNGADSPPDFTREQELRALQRVMQYQRPETTGF